MLKGLKRSAGHIVLLELIEKLTFRATKKPLMLLRERERERGGGGGGGEKVSDRHYKQTE